MLLAMLALAPVSGAAEAAQEASEALEHELHASGGLPQLDVATWPGQLFWLAVTFGVLYLLLSRIVLPRIGGAIETRRDRIADDLDAAVQYKRDADTAVAEYERQLADARARSHAMAAKNRAKLDAEIAGEVEAAEAEIARTQAAAEKRLGEMRVKALSNVKTIAADAVVALVEKLSGEAPAKDEAAAAVQSVR